MCHLMVDRSCWLNRSGSIPGTDPFPPRPAMFRIEALGPENELSQATEYPNPFVGKANVFLPLRLLLITGLPGIGRVAASLMVEFVLNDLITGKTMFLSLIFSLRVAANLPTLLMTDQIIATLSMNGETWIVPVADLPYAFQTSWIPEEIWCLLDCNTNFPQIPSPFVQGRRFVVLAASPRGANLISTKDFWTQYCVMQPWSLQELVDGYASSFSYGYAAVLTRKLDLNSKS